MIQGIDCFGKVVYREAPLAFLAKSVLSEETKKKCQNRRIVFLKQDELEKLSPQEYKAYMDIAYSWLIIDCHVGPLWLADLCHTHKHGTT